MTVCICFYYSKVVSVVWVVLFYVSNIKTSNNQKKTIPEINYNETIVNIENKIKIPKIIARLKIKEKEKINHIFKSNKNIIKNYNLDKDNYTITLEARNNISKSTNNTYNYIQVSKEKEKTKENEKEKDLKSINSDRAKLEKKNIYNTSQKNYNSIETQTPKLIFKNKNQSKIGFNYKIINLGSNINFKERNIEHLQNLKENTKVNIDLSIPLTNTYKAYQKRKYEKNNKKILLNEMNAKGTNININPKFILPIFNNNDLFKNNSFYKRKYQSIEYENTNIRNKKNTEIDRSIESVKSSKIKLITENF